MAAIGNRRPKAGSGHAIVASPLNMMRRPIATEGTPRWRFIAAGVAGVLSGIILLHYIQWACVIFLALASL
jgi:hypothetical protein